MIMFFCQVYPIFGGLATQDPNYTVLLLTEYELALVPVIECQQTTFADVIEDEFADIWEQIDAELERQGTVVDEALLLNA